MTEPKRKKSALQTISKEGYLKCLIHDPPLYIDDTTSNHNDILDYMNDTVFTTYYFILKDNELLYYESKSESSSPSLGEISLAESSIEMVTEEKYHQKSCFEIKNSKNYIIVTLAALSPSEIQEMQASPSEMQAWMMAIRRAMLNIKRARQKKQSEDIEQRRIKEREARLATFNTSRYINTNNNNNTNESTTTTSLHYGSQSKTDPTSSVYSSENVDNIDDINNNNQENRFGKYTNWLRDTRTRNDPQLDLEMSSTGNSGNDLTSKNHVTQDFTRLLDDDDPLSNSSSLHNRKQGRWNMYWDKLVRWISRYRCFRS